MDQKQALVSLISTHQFILCLGGKCIAKLDESVEFVEGFQENDYKIGCDAMLRSKRL